MDMTTRYRYLAKLGRNATMGDRPVRLSEVLIINTSVLSTIYLCPTQPVSISAQAGTFASIHLPG